MSKECDFCCSETRDHREICDICEACENYGGDMPSIDCYEDCQDVQ